MEIYENAAIQWGLIDKPAPTEVPTEIPTEVPTQEPEATEGIAQSAKPADPTTAPDKDGGSNAIVIIAIIAAILVIGGGIAAGIILTNKK